MPQCIKLNSHGDCTSRSAGDPPGLLWGCDDTLRAASAISAMRERGITVFVAGAHKRPEFTQPTDRGSLTTMALAAATPGPDAPHPYYRTDVPAQMDALRARVVEALSVAPCRFRAAQGITRESLALVFDRAQSTVTEIDAGRWRQVSETVIEVDDQAVCAIPSPPRLRLVARW